MELILDNQNRLIWPKGSALAVIGGGGLKPLGKKQEGDGATPIGRFALRRLLYRADRLQEPKTKLPSRAIVPNDGWCDDPVDIAYNRPVYLPYKASAERLFREDHLYDLLVVLAHNDQPPQPYLGSAIFFHLAKECRSPTRGCVAIAKPDMLTILQSVDQNSYLTILGP